MKKSNILLLLFAAFMITFASCTKDEDINAPEITEIPTEIDEDQYNSLLDNIENRDDLEGGLELGCFSIDTPFSLDVDGTVVEINTYEDLETAFTFDSTDVAVNVDFVYPLNITYEDGETAELADGEALGEAFALCIPDEGWEAPDSTGFDGSFPAYLICELNSCYQLVYPVTLIGTDGTTFAANSEEEFIELISTEDFLAFQFPISLDGEDGVVVADNSEDLFDLLLECDNDPWDGGDGGIDTTITIGGIGCLDLDFPLSYITTNDNEVEVNSFEEFISSVLNGSFGDFVYPVSLTNIETGESSTVNSQDEFAQALEDCAGFDNGGGDVDPPFGGNALLFFLSSNDFDGDCYSINYPVDVITSDSLQVTYDNVDNLLTVLNSGQNIPVDLVYPVDVTIIETNEIVTLTEDQALFTLVEICE